MKQMANSDKKQEPLIGLRVIEVWCWLWVPVWSIAGAVFASWGEGSIARAVATWEGINHPLSSGAIGIMAYFPGLFTLLFVTLFEGRLAIATVNLLFGVFAMVVALGHHQRKSWARKLTLVFAGLGILNSSLGLAFSAVVANGIDAPGPGLWSPEILFSILFHLAGLAISIWSISYLLRPDVKEAFGLYSK
jgi:hypothetical protein